MHSAPRPSRKWPIHLAVVLGFIVGPIALTIALAAEPKAKSNHHPPDTVMLDELENLYKPVPFDHKSHAGMAMMWNGCTTCHHAQPEEDAGGQPADGKPHTQEETKKIPACKSCHPTSPEEGTIRKPSLKAAYHRQCLNCHRDWSKENQCVICHQPAQDAQGIKHQPTKDDIIGRMHPPIKAEAVKVFKTRFTPAAGDNVIFRHDEHLKRFGLTCNECHHRDTCNDCHHLEGEKAGPRKPVVPAASWDQSHGPCLGCHQDQQCNHCHYPDGHEPPPAFEHAMTGQLLDDDHSKLECKECHATYGYHKQPYCGDAECHPNDPQIKFPDQKPGPVKKPQTPRPPDPLVIANPVKRTAQDKLPILYIRDEAVAQQIDPYPTAKVVDPKNNTDEQSCIQSDCHEDRLNFPFVHGPVAAKDCGACHQLTDEKDHRFKLLRDKTDLCTYCHQFDVSEMPVQHEPIKTGQCLGCHNPHGGQDASLTREKSIQQMCQRCHWPITKDKKVLHHPVKEGRCTSCHTPHASRNPKLLDKAGADLCLTCHTDFSQSLDKVMYRHDALKEGCLKCHDVHGSNHPLALVESLDRLCHQCHEKTVKAAKDANHRHSVVFSERGCATCHTPHGGDLDHLMAETSAEKSALGCHDKPITDPTDEKKVLVADMSALGNEKLHKHGPLREGSCSGCHQPHGGELDHMLVKPYSFNLRQPFSVDLYALCFDCHEPQMVKQTKSNTATNFRNGDVNLHYIHVTKGDRGRNCFACHNVHVSTNAKNVKAKVTYREWQFTMRFTATETGGQCVTGCHLPFAYDREKPVLITPNYSGPIMLDATDPAGDVVVKPIKIDWKGKDLKGQPVTLPQEDRRTVVVFVPGDADPLPTLRDCLVTARPGDYQAGVMLVCPDRQSADRLGKLDPKIPGDWTLVIDADNALSQRLEVRGYPLVIIVDQQGNAISRISGNSAATSLKLRTHLHWLTQKSDERSKLPPQTHPTLLSDRQVGKDTWYVESARRHIEQGRLEQAKAVIEKGLAATPDSADLKAQLAVVLMRTDKADEAINLIDGLQQKDANNPSLELLRCEALVAMNQLDPAKARLNILLDGPIAGQAYFLLGKIHEKQQQWQQAAEAYRKAGQAK